LFCTLYRENAIPSQNLTLGVRSFPHSSQNHCSGAIRIHLQEVVFGNPYTYKLFSVWERPFSGYKEYYILSFAGSGNPLLTPEASHSEMIISYADMRSNQVVLNGFL
jgi:hypothetical protein